MTTRSGKIYQPGMTEEKPTAKSAETALTATLDRLLQTLLDDRAKREQDLLDERRRHDEELRMMREMLEGARREEPAPERRAFDGLKLKKLADGEDIEAFLTVFERVMQARRTPQDQWSYILAPLLTGKAQLACTALSAADSARYNTLKDAGLRRYDINSETYRQRLRQAELRDGETPCELVTRLKDLASKWLKDRATRDDVLDAVVLEQFLTTMPPDLRVWLGERKPKTAAEAAGLADNYVIAREAEAKEHPLTPLEREKKPPGDRGPVNRQLQGNQEKGQPAKQHPDSRGQPFGSRGRGRQNTRFADR